MLSLPITFNKPIITSHNIRSKEVYDKTTQKYANDSMTFISKKQQLFITRNIANCIIKSDSTIQSEIKDTPLIISVK